jgi:hypothetical protein
MDEKELGEEAAALKRARLHIRGGKRRLRQGKTAAGLAALYDALETAMRWYVFVSRKKGEFAPDPNLDLENGNILYKALVRSKVLDGEFDFEEFEECVSKFLNKEQCHMDWREKIHAYEQVMEQLGVMPFDEDELPPEDPATF